MTKRKSKTRTKTTTNATTTGATTSASTTTTGATEGDAQIGVTITHSPTQGLKIQAQEGTNIDALDKLVRAAELEITNSRLAAIENAVRQQGEALKETIKILEAVASETGKSTTTPSTEDVVIDSNDTVVTTTDTATTSTDNPEITTETAV